MLGGGTHFPAADSRVWLVFLPPTWLPSGTFLGPLGQTWGQQDVVFWTVGSRKDEFGTLKMLIFQLLSGMTGNQNMNPGI